MKYPILFFLLICFAAKNVYAQDSTKNKLAEGYELKQYFFVMLTKGPNKNQDSVTAAKIQEGHMANINRPAKLGKIIVAGPFGDESSWRGVFIFDCQTEKEVNDYLKTDPAVAAGRLNYEIHPWWTAKNCLFK